MVDEPLAGNVPAQEVLKCVPIFGEMGQVKLPQGALCYMNLRDVLDITTVATVAAMVTYFFADGQMRVILWSIIAALLLISAAVELPFLNRVRVKYTTYSVNSEYVYITRGALVRNSTLIPTRQILNVESIQGPLLSKLGYAKVRFRSISGSVSLGPLDATAVENIRRAVALRRSDNHAGG